MDSTEKAKVTYEISQIDELVGKAQVLVSLCESKEPDFIEITAVGGVPHSFYNGLENIFVLFGKSLGFDFDASPRWHRNLIDFMFARFDFLPSDLLARLTLKACIMTTGEFAGHLVAGFCVSFRRNIPVAAQSVLYFPHARVHQSDGGQHRGRAHLLRNRGPQASGRGGEKERVD